MPISKSLCVAGFEAELDALLATHGVFEAQQNALQAVILQHNQAAFLPANLIGQTRQAAYLKGMDKEILETLILVGTVASFQKFLKLLVSDVVNHYSSTYSRFSELRQDFRDSYLSALASTYRFKKSGSVRGVVINFQRVEQSLKECLNDDQPFTLQGDAITSEMGNPNTNAIENIMDSLSLGKPFDSNNFGASLRKYGWNKSPNDGDNLRDALAFLSKNIGRRNDAVHNFGKIVFSPGEIKEIIDFFRSFSKSLFEYADSRI